MKLQELLDKIEVTDKETGQVFTFVEREFDAWHYGLELQDNGGFEGNLYKDTLEFTIKK